MIMVQVIKMMRTIYNNSISAKCTLENDSKSVKTKHDVDETEKLSPRKKLKKTDEKKDAD